MNIAVGYLRCSTDMQDDSVEQQKQEIQKWADANDYKVIEWYEDEGKSGTTFEKRPAFMRLMRRVESGANFEHILVYDESRWGRPNNPRERTPIGRSTLSVMESEFVLSTAAQGMKTISAVL